jgi:hypothetical protein
MQKNGAYPQLTYRLAHSNELRVQAAYSLMIDSPCMNGGSLLRSAKACILRPYPLLAGRMRDALFLHIAFIRKYGNIPVTEIGRCYWFRNHNFSERSTMTRTSGATPSKITEITTKVVKMLAPLVSDERQKVIQASLMLLGEAGVGFGGSNTAALSAGSEDSGKTAPGVPGLSAKANAWVRQNGITSAQLEEVFDITAEGAAVIASAIPGKNGKEKTINAYVIQGVARLLVSGEGSFDDKSARELCETLGCYNSPNHALYLSAVGNALTGSKDKGWRLTAPGLKKGAELVKEITKGA